MSKTKAVNPLANPKNVKHVCELSGKPAFIQCNKSKTYYCSVEHQKLDWDAIQNVIWPYVAELKTDLPFLGSEAERQRRDSDRIDKQKYIIELTRTHGQKHLFEKRFNEAIPAALQSLKYSIEVYGTSSIELVISYLMLAEASIGLEKLDQAEKYLSQAEWTVLKTDGVGNDYKSKLYTNMGLLYDAKKNYQEALRNFANGIYYASEEYGTDDIRTSAAYFYMANVFRKQNRSEVTDSMFKQVVNIWKDKLEEICTSKLSRPTTTADSKRNILGKKPDVKQDMSNELDIAQQAEAHQVLNSIWEYWDQLENPETNSIVTLLMAKGYLEYYLDNTQKSLEYLENAKKILTSNKMNMDGDKLLDTIETVQMQIQNSRSIFTRSNTMKTE